jgi:hypothetical protein
MPINFDIVRHGFYIALTILMWLSIYAGVYAAAFYIIFKQQQELIYNWFFKVIISVITVPVLLFAASKFMAGAPVDSLSMQLFGIAFINKLFLPVQAYTAVGGFIARVFLSSSFLTILDTYKVHGTQVVLAMPAIFALVHLYVTVFLSRWLTGKFTIKNLLLLIGISFVAYSFAVAFFLIEFKLRFGTYMVEQKLARILS